MNIGMLMSEHNCTLLHSMVSEKYSKTPLLTLLHTCCDSNFEVKCSNFKSSYKWNKYLAL